MAKVVAIGPADEVIGLTAAGVEVVALEPGASLGEALRSAAGEPEVAIVLVSEPSLGGNYRLVSEVRAQSGKVILVIPSYRGAQGLTLGALKHALEQSIGVDLISK